MLEVVNAAPVELPLGITGVLGATAALVKVAVVVASNDDDMPEAICGAWPGLLQGLEPVYALLDGSEGAIVGQVTRMDEDITPWNRLGGNFAVTVGETDDADGDLILWRLVGCAA